jgi:hypothetical protein
MIYLILIATALALFIATFVFYVSIMKMREIQDHIFIRKDFVKYKQIGGVGISLHRSTNPTVRNN